MPHAVIQDASEAPSFGTQPIAREGRVVHKVAEVAETTRGWLLKSIVIDDGEPTKFFTRIDRREDGLLVRLDDHVDVERGPRVFDHLALLAKMILAANPGSTLGKTNLADRIEAIGGAAEVTDSRAR
ncbi:MAG TPA: hypothetical protein VM889_01425 [Candidatus Thermoplasmatota archaeon]|nr:hypothetical protein [Candidatus Thermoplasmatota archaeon]